MYGGHITDAFDRRLASAYLDTYMLDELFEGFEIFPGFNAPNQAQNVKEVIEAIETTMPQETPVAFGLHNNAEIGFRMKQADEMFLSIRELQPRSGGGIVGMSVTERAKTLLDELVEKMPDAFDFGEVVERVEERSPYVNVFLQEIERSRLFQTPNPPKPCTQNLSARVLCTHWH
jgi:dynein heavy chain